jgi:hypothetical protein
MPPSASTRSMRNFSATMLPISRGMLFAPVKLNPGPPDSNGVLIRHSPHRRCVRRYYRDAAAPYKTDSWAVERRVAKLRIGRTPEDAPRRGRAERQSGKGKKPRAVRPRRYPRLRPAEPECMLALGTKRVVVVSACAGNRDSSTFPRETVWGTS